jgi:hypothetical protein
VHQTESKQARSINTWIKSRGESRFCSITWSLQMSFLLISNCYFFTLRLIKFSYCSMLSPRV